MKRGGAVVFPTDTVTGLGCMATDARAVRGLRKLKRREAGKPLVLFVNSIPQAEKFTGHLPLPVRKLLKSAWPGAFTAVLPLKRRLPRGVGRGKTVGIRIPGHPAARALVRRLGAPLATTSANLRGKPPSPDALAAARSWGGRVAAVPGESGRVPSTVTDLTKWPPVVLRKGRISVRALERMVRKAEKS